MDAGINNELGGGRRHEDHGPLQLSLPHCNFLFWRKLMRASMTSWCSATPQRCATCTEAIAGNVLESHCKLYIGTPQVGAGIEDELVLGDPTAPRYVYWSFAEKSLIELVLAPQVDAGIDDELVLGDPTAPRYVYWDGELLPTPSGPDVLTFKLLSFWGKIRAGLGAVGIKKPMPGAWPPLSRCAGIRSPLGRVLGRPQSQPLSGLQTSSALVHLARRHERVLRATA